jgi:hypothetical protein
MARDGTRRSQIRPSAGSQLRRATFSSTNPTDTARHTSSLELRFGRDAGSEFGREWGVGAHCQELDMLWGIFALREDLFSARRSVPPGARSPLGAALCIASWPCTCRVAVTRLLTAFKMDRLRLTATLTGSVAHTRLLPWPAR